MRLKPFCLLFILVFILSSGNALFAFEYDPHGKKDPMIPVVDKDGRVLFKEDEESGKKVVALRLQGIIYKDKGISKAVIENKLYKVGDKVSGFVIKDITPDKVILSDGRERYELTVIKRTKPTNKKH